MSTMSTRFALKEKREGKITKIGLTWLTSTPSNPYGSRAEACQPQPMFSAACQGRGNDTSPGCRPMKQGVIVDQFAGRPNSLYKRRRRIFIVFFL